MNRPDVQDAVAEAKRFVKRAEALLKTEVPEWVWDEKAGRGQYVKRPWTGVSGPCKEAAAAKRSSLDLSRSLAQMRRRL